MNNISRTSIKKINNDFIKIILDNDNLTLLEVLNLRAQATPSDICCVYLSDAEETSVSISYKELQSRAHSIACKIQQVTEAKDRVLLLFPPGIELICAIFGCMISGTIAVLTPIPNPDNAQFAKLYKVFESIFKNSQPAAVLCNSRFHQDYTILINPILNKTCRWIFSDRCFEMQNVFPEQRSQADNTACLLYTSGSTAEPKGVMITHKNIISMAIVWEDITNNYLSSGGPIVMWMPMHHISGLMAILETIFTGQTLVYIETNAMLQRPLRWLKAIEKYKAKITGGPNFSYELCCNSIDDENVKNLNLGNLELAFNAAEYVKPETMHKFSNKFSTAGFKISSFYPSYGLTETTSTVCLKRQSSKDNILILNFDSELLENKKVMVVPDTYSKKFRVLVGQGAVIEQLEVIIVNPETLLECDHDEVGEIWIKGNTVAKGYWLNEADTEKTFKAYTNKTNKGPYLRTGDFGFIYSLNIFIVGRVKDLIIINGKNYHPVDIESSIESGHEQIKKGGCVVFSIEEDSRDESIVALIETDLIVYDRKENKTLLADISKEVRKKIASEYNLPIANILFLNPGMIPRTLNGKLMRNEAKKQYANGNFNKSNTLDWY
jgi:acyl-CoA synthetase (AMP-forming)/AMP-acid ligase II